MSLASLESVGIVIIGRNEGERLRTCLLSVSSRLDRVVYVDSGSTDGSVAIARTLSAFVVELDLRLPFTAARARNEGFKALRRIHPSLKYVFFVDGDCEVLDGWLDLSCRFLESRPDVAVVWGLRRERHPDRSVYNLLCDIEWTGCIAGETKYCGGDALIRTDAFLGVNGYRPELICGEEPEMCVRLRQQGWRIWHLREPMTFHDAAIFNFRQWWKRMLRGGYCFAQAAAMHGGAPERHGMAESIRAWLYGLAVPILTMLLCVVFGPWAILLLLVYPLQVFRLWLGGTRSTRENFWWGAALVIGKFPEVMGQMKYWIDRYRRVQSRLIEYK